MLIAPLPAAGLGGRSIRAHDIPNIGRFAVVADPKEPSFNLFKTVATRPAQGLERPGQNRWHELHTK